MTLSAPGPFWYYAILESVSPAGSASFVVGHFSVFDGAGTRHNGLDTTRTIPQEYLDVWFDLNNVANVREVVRAAVQELVVVEHGYDLQAMISASISQKVKWQ